MKNLNFKRKNAIICYDNSGVSFDRYTVVFKNRIESYQSDSKTVKKTGFTRHMMRPVCEALAASDSPFNHLGVGMHTSAIIGRHLGKKIAFEQLPADVQKFVRQNLI
jgi:hypothetical protein